MNFGLTDCSPPAPPPREGPLVEQIPKPFLCLSPTCCGRKKVKLNNYTTLLQGTGFNCSQFWSRVWISLTFVDASCLPESATSTLSHQVFFSLRLFLCSFPRRTALYPCGMPTASFQTSLRRPSTYSTRGSPQTDRPSDRKRTRHSQCPWLRRFCAA